ncbi:MAG: hypothetical protein ABF546_07550, partial [Lentilactobacillus hilgardii]
KPTVLTCRFPTFYGCLLHPQTANELSGAILPKLRMILYSSLHNVFVVGLILILTAYAINWFDRKKTDVQDQRP